MKRGRDDGSKENIPRKKQNTTTGAAQNAQYKQLRVEDALAYLELVKQKFSDKPTVYNKFLDIMKDFKAQTIDTPGVIARVSDLFRGHTSLILGFNTFLPPGYKIELEDVERQERERQAKEEKQKAKDTKSGKQPTIDFDQAISYVTKIKSRFSDQPETYKSFLDILHTYQKEQTTIKKVYEQVATLFKDHADLLDEFTQFLPVPVTASKKATKKKEAKKMPPVIEPTTTRQSNRKRKAASRADDRIRKQNDEDEPYLNAANEDQEQVPNLFETIKSRLDSSDYDEFLKCVDLYTANVVEKKELLQLCGFLPKDLMKEFKRMINDGSLNGLETHAPFVNRTNTFTEERMMMYEGRREYAQKSNANKYGPSYRILPRNFPQPQCSERSDLCNEVLNDELVSVSAGSEESRDTHRKSQYDEIVFQCEDDRTELDIVIEQNLSTISFLEPMLEALKADENAKLKLDALRDIHRASISRIYGDKGIEILEGLRKNPSVAIPIILKRLKQKDVEWKNARKELNKFWREIYDKNNQKAMEEQCANFKLIDKKTINPKTILNDMDLRHEYNKELIAHFDDPSIHDDIMFLLLHVSELSEQDLKDSKALWKNVIVPFFAITLSDSPEKVEGDYVGKSWLKVISDEINDENNDYQPIVEQNLHKKSKRHQLFTNSTMLLFLRYYMFMYERLYQAKDLARKEMRNAQKPEPTADSIVRSHEALEPPTTAPIPPSDADADYNYRKFMNVLVQWFKGGDPNTFEESAKKLLGYEGWITYTLDKVFANMQKPLHALLSDDMCLQLIDAFKYENQRANRFCDNSYYIHAQKIVGHETCYMFEYNIENHKLKVNIVNPPELDPEKVKAEAQGLDYVQKYLTSTNTQLEKSRHVYLKRNKKIPQDQANKNLIIVNGLECKICIATYKMYYVEETEDYMERKRVKKPIKKRPATKWYQFVEKRAKEIAALPEPISTTPNNNNNNNNNITTSEVAPTSAPVVDGNAMDTSAM
jgi:paired amphipathic helix protein Sin3a